MGKAKTREYVAIVVSDESKVIHHKRIQGYLTHAKSGCKMICNIYRQVAGLAIVVDTASKQLWLARFDRKAQQLSQWYAVRYKFMRRLLYRTLVTKITIETLNKKYREAANGQDVSS